jgi:hypothetical protein
LVHVPVEALRLLPCVALPLIVGTAVFAGAVDAGAGGGEIGATGEVVGGTGGGNNGDNGGGFLRLLTFTQRCTRV